MRHVYVANERALYSFTEDSVVKITDQDLDEAQLRDNPEITYVNKDPIFYAGIALTNHCNLNCKYCLVETTKSATEHTKFSLEGFTQLLKGLTKQGLVRASITGGEPFTYPHLVDVFKLLSQYDIKANINSNGTLLNHETIGQMIEYGLVEIDVSITDLHDDSHVYFDGINRAKVRLKNLEKLVKAFKGEILITASSVLTNKVVDNLFEMETALSNIGIDRWRLREILSSETNITSEYFYGQPEMFLSKIVEFANAERKIPVLGYLYDIIVSGQNNWRCSNLENNYVYVNFNKEVYWLARLSANSFAKFNGDNISEIADKLTNECYSLQIPERCKNCPAGYFCSKAPQRKFHL